MRRSFSKFAHFIGVVGLCVLAWSSGAFAQSYQLQSLVSGLDAPLFVTHAGDSSGRLFILEQGGRIRILNDSTLRESDFLDLSAEVSRGGERGLLGLAFHPSYESNRRFFVSFTDPLGDLIVAEYQASASDSNQADPTSKRIILRVRHRQFSNHNGGMLAFGKDGFLYIGTGDGGGGGDPLGSGQRRSTLLGKVLRIDVNTTRRYRVPRSNPFFGERGVRKEIYALGIRNPWRFSFDRVGGRLLLGDVGQGAREEVNLIVRGGNYGWNQREGTLCYEPSTGCKKRGLITPVSEYGRELGSSITGGYVYRGPTLTGLTGRYIFGDFISGRIWTLTKTRRKPWRRELLLETNLAISSFGEDETGEVYVVDYGGTVYRLTL